MRVTNAAPLAEAFAKIDASDLVVIIDHSINSALHLGYALGSGKKVIAFPSKHNFQGIGSVGSYDDLIKEITHVT